MRTPKSAAESPSFCRPHESHGLEACLGQRVKIAGPGVSIGSVKGQTGWQGVGPFEVPIVVRGDGAVVFNFAATERLAGPAIPGYQPLYGERTPDDVSEAEEKRMAVGYARLEYMNAWVAGYMGGMSKIQAHTIITPPPVDPLNHLKAERRNGVWLVYDIKLKVLSGSDEPSPVSPDVFDYACNILFAAERALGSNFAAARALFQQSSYQFRIHQFASAHLSAWSLSEQVLNVMWRAYQREASEGPDACTAMSKKRRELLNGRDYTASIITQALSLAGRLPDERLGKLDQARRDRNAFAHSLTAISGTAAHNALTVASEMLSDLMAIRLSAQLSNTFWL